MKIPEWVCVELAMIIALKIASEFVSTNTLICIGFGTTVGLITAYKYGR